MVGPRDHHTEWSDRKTNIIWYPLHQYVKCKKIRYKWTDTQNTGRLPDTESKLMVTKGGRQGGKLGVWN